MIVSSFEIFYENAAKYDVKNPGGGKKGPPPGYTSIKKYFGIIRVRFAFLIQNLCRLFTKLMGSCAL